MYESRFLRKCIDGGHAGIGHRRRAVGNEDFLRRVKKQDLASNKRPPAKKRFATRVSLPRRRKPSSRTAKKMRQAHAVTVVSASRKTVHFKKAYWFQALMHFSAYLMAAALVLMGLQLAFAFYQLATIIL